MDITEIPLSGYEMQILNPDSKIIVYTDLYKYDNINDLFKDTNKLIILYLVQSKTSGHWVCLFKNKDGFNWFDSYGVDVDKERNFLTKSKQIELNEQYDYLSKLLKPYKVIYNNVRLQNKHTQTCGCHTTYRLHNYKMNLQDYVDNLFIKKNIKNPDLEVAKYCFKKLKYI